MLRILLVDDQHEVRRGLIMHLSLEADFEVVGEARNGAEALLLAPTLHPDVVIMDLQLPDMDGITVMQELHALYPSCTIVALSIFDDSHTQDLARAAGAAAFVSKRVTPEILPRTIRWATKKRA